MVLNGVQKTQHSQGGQKDKRGAVPRVLVDGQLFALPKAISLSLDVVSIPASRDERALGLTTGG